MNAEDNFPEYMNKMQLAPTYGRKLNRIGLDMRLLKYASVIMIYEGKSTN